MYNKRSSFRNLNSCNVILAFPSSLKIYVLVSVFMFIIIYYFQYSIFIGTQVIFYVFLNNKITSYIYIYIVYSYIFINKCTIIVLIKYFIKYVKRPLLLGNDPNAKNSSYWLSFEARSFKL